MFHFKARASEYDIERFENKQKIFTTDKKYDWLRLSRSQTRTTSNNTQQLCTPKHIITDLSSNCSTLNQCYFEPVMKKILSVHGLHSLHGLHG